MIYKRGLITPKKDTHLAFKLANSLRGHLGQNESAQHVGLRLNLELIRKTAAILVHTAIFSTAILTIFWMNLMTVFILCAKVPIKIYQSFIIFQTYLSVLFKCNKEGTLKRAAPIECATKGGRKAHYFWHTLKSSLSGRIRPLNTGKGNQLKSNLLTNLGTLHFCHSSKGMCGQRK